MEEERAIFDHAAKMGGPFQSRLRALAEHPLVGDVRGVGLIGAVELVADKATKAAFNGAAAYCAARAADHGLIVRNIGESVALCPPLVIDDEQVDELFTKLERALDDTLRHVNSL